MISLASLMWATAIFFAFMGALRGWSRELVGTAGIVLGVFAIFQFDALLRGTIFLLMSPDQVFGVQLIIFLSIVFLAYRSQGVVDSDEGRGRIQSGILGIIVGFANGYFVAGSIWYFLDINRYPFPQFVTAPAQGSVTYNALDSMPIVLLGGGLAGNGDLLAVAVIVLLAIVIMIV